MNHKTKITIALTAIILVATMRAIAEKLLLVII